MKFREDWDLIALSKQGNVAAQLELWKKWEPFTQKHFYMSQELFENTGVFIEDYMQSAFVSFMNAVQHYDLEKAKAKGSKNFSTVYYWFLLKLKNEALTQVDRYGTVIMNSSFTPYDEEDTTKTDAVDNSWNRAITKDIKDEFKKKQAIEVIDTYLEEENNPIYRKVIHFLLMGKGLKTIEHLLDDEYSYKDVKTMVSEIHKKVQNIAQRVAFEPILS